MKAVICTVLCLIISMVSPGPVAARSLADSADDCLVFWVRLFDFPLTQQAIDSAVDEQLDQSAKFSSNTIVSIAGRLGIRLVERVTTLAALRDHGGYAVARFTKPDRFVVVVAIGETSCLLYDNGNYVVAPNADVSLKIKDGVLVPESSLASEAQVRVVNSVREAKPLVLSNESQKYDFEVDNDSPKGVFVSVAFKSCSCVMATLPDSVIAPHSSGCLTVALQPGGANLAIVLLKSDDPTASDMVIAIKRDEAALPVADPSSVTFRIGEGEHSRKYVNILLSVGSRVTSLEAEKALFSAGVISQTPAANGTIARIYIDGPGDRPAGYVHDLVDVHTAGTTVQVCRISADAYISPRLLSSPSSVFLQRIETGQTLTRCVVLKSWSGRKFSILGAECSQNGVTVKLSDAPERDGSHLVHLRVRVTSPSRERMLLQANVKISTSLGSCVITLIGIVTQRSG